MKTKKKTATKKKNIQRRQEGRVTGYLVNIFLANRK